MPNESEAKPPKILYIGRVDPSHEKLWQQFQQEEIGVAFARTQRAGLQMAWDMKPLIVIINTSNGAFTGARLCRTLGRSLPNVQRLLITESLAGANIPCERHLPRPFTPSKLRDVIFGLLEVADPHVLRAGDLQVNAATRIFTGPNGQHRLTPKECSLLLFLMRRPNQVFSRRQIMQDVWETPYFGDTRTLDVHVRWLREKIEPDPEHPTVLVTRRGVGYVLIIPRPAAEPTDDLLPEVD